MYKVLKYYDVTKSNVCGSFWLVGSDVYYCICFAVVCYQLIEVLSIQGYIPVTELSEKYHNNFVWICLFGYLTRRHLAQPQTTVGVFTPRPAKFQGCVLLEYYNANFTYLNITRLRRNVWNVGSDGIITIILILQNRKCLIFSNEEFYVRLLKNYTAKIC